MSQINVNTIGARTGTTISVASGHTLQDADGNAIASGGLTKLYSTSVTGSSSVSQDNVFTSTYNHYRIYVTGKGNTGLTYYKLRLRSGGSTNTANYRWDEDYFRLDGSGSTGTNNNSYSNDTGWFIRGVAGANAFNTMHSVVELYYPQNTSHLTSFLSKAIITEFNSSYQGAAYRTETGGWHESKTANDGFEIYDNNGNSFDADITVFGIAK